MKATHIPNPIEFEAWTNFVDLRWPECVLDWGRLSAPFQVVPLSTLAVPLSRDSPKARRSVNTAIRSQRETPHCPRGDVRLHDMPALTFGDTIDIEHLLSGETFRRSCNLRQLNRQSATPKKNCASMQMSAGSCLSAAASNCDTAVLALRRAERRRRTNFRSLGRCPKCGESANSGPEKMVWGALL